MSARAWAIAALISLVAPPALAARPDSTSYHLYQPGRHVAPTTTPTMLYFGGPVLANVKVASVFWGPDIAKESLYRISPFLKGLVNSTYVDQLAQYSTNLVAVNGQQGTNQTIARGTYLGHFIIAPSDRKLLVTDGDIQTELLAQIAAHKLPANDLNTLYMVYFPAKIHILLGNSQSCVQFGAYHSSTSAAVTSSNVFYGVIPDCADFAFQTIVSSHEFAEAVTDAIPTPGSNPAYPQAWNTSNGYEIGDLCESSLSTMTYGTLTFHVQEVFDNKTNACGTGTFTSP